VSTEFFSGHHRAALALGLLAMSCLPFTAAESQSSPPNSLAEIVIETPEPRFVEPTRRDKIGRIWAPVLINGKGPFRLALDTGATSSAVNASVAAALGVAPDVTQRVMLRGVTGSSAVPTIRVESFAVGDIILTSATLPIVADALGGAEGVLGMEGFADKRLYIDFEHDLITIAHSRGTRAGAGFVTIPFVRSRTGLLVIQARVAGVRVQAIIDTGGQGTIGNDALRAALVRRRTAGTWSPVTDVTSTTQDGETFPSPPIELGGIQVRGAQITYGDMHIFEHWHLSKDPVLLIGMDAIGLFDVFIIDYSRRELQLRMR
jgi:predicted aspartyl protease